MRSMFCSICGKEGVPLHDSFCYDCYWKDNHSATLKKEKVELNTCLTCGSVLLPGGWSTGNTPETLPDLLLDRARKWINTPLENDVKAYAMNNPDWDDGKPSLTLLIKVVDRRIEEFPPHEENLTLVIDFLWGTCEICAKKETGGDTVLQVRAIDRFITEDELNFIEKTLREQIEKMGDENPYYFISERIDVHKGYDYKCGSNTMVEHVIEILKNKWASQSSVNYSLVGESKDGTRKYQHTYLFKLPGVKVGDLIFYDNSVCRVDAITSWSVAVMNLRTLELHHIKEWKDLRPLDFYEEPTYLVMSKTYDTYELMHLGDYHIFEIPADIFQRELELGKEQQFLVYKGEFYLR